MQAQRQWHSTQSPSRQRDLKRRACDICKRRKVRCDGGNPCQNCVRQEVNCQYTASHGRIAHAERRSKQLQDRLQAIESAWKRYLPNVDLAAALREGDQHHHQSDVDITPSPEVNSDAFNVQWLQDDAVTDVAHNALATVSPPDSEYEDAETLAWDESTATDAAADGIASLSMNWKGIGYMGPQTGNTLLRKLQSISILYLPIGDDDDAALRSSLDITLPDQALKSPHFANQCIEWYFKHYHSTYPILHEGQFRAQLMGALPKPKDGSWSVLYNVVLALGACSGDRCNENADLHFYRQAANHLSWDLLRRGTLSLVQTFALLADYLQKRNKPNSAFTLLGMAMNMAQGIGIHRELSVPAMTTFNMEIHRRVWWTLFVLDSAARLTFGRPTLSLGGVSTCLPRNLNDSDVTVDLDELPPALEVPTIVSSLIWQTKLAKIGNAANERLVAKHIPDQAVMLALGEEVNQWVSALPLYMREDYSEPGHESFAIPRMVLLWRSMHLRIIIYRPYLIDHIRQKRRIDFNNPKAPVTCCFSAASECIRSITCFLNNTSCNGALIWYACYFLVTAVFVYITCLLYEPQHSAAAEWRRNIEESKAMLEFMGPFEPTAMRAAHLLDRILALAPVSPDSTFLALNEPIRMELAEELWDQSWADLMVPQDPSPSRVAAGDIFDSSNPFRVH